VQKKIEKEKFWPPVKEVNPTSGQPPFRNPPQTH
jgi:hypothetical protein